MSSYIKNYKGLLSLIGGIAVGAATGALFGNSITFIKSVGDIFLNLLFVAVIPLVFFAIASAIANLHGTQKVGRIMVIMGGVFFSTVLLAALLAIAGVKVFHIYQPMVNASGFATNTGSQSLSAKQVTQLVSTDEFYLLLSRKNMLGMIIFAILTGFGTLHAREKGEAFKSFLNAGNEVFKNVFILIMQLGPLGLGAYFAYQVSVFGPSLFGAYGHTMAVGYSISIFYFFVFFTFYAFIAGGIKGVKTYWKNNIIPSATAVGTCSSIATIPANLEAAKAMHVSGTIAGITIPLGATLHKDGSSISSVLKMAAVFALFGRGFDSPQQILLALGITVLVSIVEGGIPNGGYVGEMLFISAYGFPPEALPVAIIIGTLIDPVATLLNATGDTVAAMLISRIIEGHNWPDKANSAAL